MFAGISLLFISGFSLALCLLSLVRLKQRLNRYELPVSTNTLMWKRVTLRHFASMYIGLIGVWIFAGFIAGIILIIK
jgi:hypothetical protein